ncbi:MAG: GHKL domain-containing protein [Prevotellaceae bacterium]|jgi:signal transduction histidine kinase|nr:GHKL domain-containing protein [Prevotellaceae bacterium]
MNNKIKIPVSILFVAVFYLLSYFYTDSLEKSISETGVDAIEKKLHILQNEGNNLISNIISLADSSFSTVDSIFPKNLYTKGICFFITDSISENILYWSDNLPIKVEKLKNVNEKTQYMFLGNSWYAAWAKYCNNFKYIVLILIEREYPYQNQFLKDGTNPEFGFSENAIIQPLGADIGIPVKSIDGSPLFVVNSNIPQITASNTILILRWLSFMSLFVCIMFVFCNTEIYRKNLLYLALFILILTALRIFLIYNREFFNGKLYLFSPMLYANSQLLPSLGDLLLHVIFVFALMVAVSMAKEPLFKKIGSLSLNSKLTLYLISCILLSICLYFTSYIIKSLVLNSEISFKIYKMNNISAYTFVACFIIGMIFAQITILLNIQAFIFSSVKKILHFILPASVAVLTVVAIDGFCFDNLLIIILFLLINILFICKENRQLTFFDFVLTVSLISFYASYSLTVNEIKREYAKRTLLAQNLLSERDPVAEMLLKDIEEKIAVDPHIQNILYSERFNSDALYNILTDKYFRGYFQSYELRLTVCKPDENLNIVDENRYENCIEFFDKQRESRGGIPLSENSNFWFMNNYWGRIHYFGFFKFTYDNSTVFMFLELYLKHEVKNTGYPELLKFDTKGIDFELEGYSYAKYANGILVAKYGTYDYSFEFTDKIHENSFSEEDGYSHFVFTVGDNNAVILSRPDMGFSDAVSMFSYSFVIFTLIFLLLFAIAGLKFETNTSTNSYRWRISFVILAGIIGALTSLTAAMIAYTVSQSEKNNKEDIRSRMQSIVIELEDWFDKKLILNNIPELEQTLIRLSNAFYTDLNIYDISGNLIASSRNEIFEKNLSGTKMNREAFYALTVEKQSKFIHLERIGEMNYFSSYLTCYNKESEPVAILNLPCFDKQFKVRNELLSLTGAIMNIYIFLIMIGIALSVFISNQITRPLDLVRRKMAKLNFNEPPEIIDYKANNELGNLVREYNRMIGELAESAKIMAENERESAWREMARQIAHEIKNPLTPMKLNIQLSLRLKNQNREGWREKMEETMKSILEQIDVLSNIASEFSNFARAGIAKLEPVDLADSINASILLFSGYGNVKIGFYCDELKKYTVKANKEQLHRVLTNLIKNSIQATENVSSPEIVLKLSEDSNRYILDIFDNGIGISEEGAKFLFRPNFTTKSGGTGLGLAISKNLIESFGGSISFIPQKTGACFRIILYAIQN